MINSGTKIPQLASCVLHYNDDDSREGLLNTMTDISTYSADAAGIGLCMSNIRSKESRLSTSGGYAGGLLKYLKIVPTFTTANVSFSNSVTTLTSCNINNSDFVLGFSENGRAEAINVVNYTKSNVAVAGTFSNSGINTTQWKSERILIGDPEKGVFSCVACSTTR